MSGTMPPRRSSAKAAVAPPPVRESLDLRAVEEHGLKSLAKMNKEDIHTLLLALGIPFETSWKKDDKALLLSDALFKRLFFFVVNCERANKSGVIRVPRATPVDECIVKLNEMLANHNWVVHEPFLELMNGGSRVISLNDVDFGATVYMRGTYRQLAVAEPRILKASVPAKERDSRDNFVIKVEVDIKEIAGERQDFKSWMILAHPKMTIAEIKERHSYIPQEYMKTDYYTFTFGGKYLVDTDSIEGLGIVHDDVLKLAFLPRKMLKGPSSSSAAAVAASSSGAASSSAVIVHEFVDDFVEDPPSDKGEPTTAETQEAGEEEEGDAEEGEEEEEQEQDEEEEPEEPQPTEREPPTTRTFLGLEEMLF